MEVGWVWGGCWRLTHGVVVHDASAWEAHGGIARLASNPIVLTYLLT